jgi:hypothetical protein
MVRKLAPFALTRPAFTVRDAPNAIGGTHHQPTDAAQDALRKNSTHARAAHDFNVALTRSNNSSNRLNVSTESLGRISG